MNSKLIDKPWVHMGHVRHLHFIGIGGAGMNGIAEVLSNLKFVVSGSDLRASDVTRHLESIGIQVHIGHSADNVKGADAVVISSAVHEDNPELQEARALRIPVVARAQMLAEIMRFFYGVAVAGTHGKTTTTSLIASILSEGNLDPTFVVGGRLNHTGAHARLGTSKYLVAEADESDASFLYLLPMIAVVTNVEADHMHTYGNDVNKLHQTFLEFLHHLPFYGLAVLCVDDPNVKDLLPQVSRPVRTYGIGTEADVMATQIRFDGQRSFFHVSSNGLFADFDCVLNLPGRHNVLNTLAAISVAHELGVPTDSIKKALAEFEGVRRRFNVHQIKDPKGRDVIIVDDYGHHPSEVLATMDAVRSGWPGRRLVLVFQPHRYSRTQDCFDDFVVALSQADRLILTEVYAAGETPIAGADSRNLTRAIRNRGIVEPLFAPTLDEIPELLEAGLEDGDVVLVSGAGDIGQLANNLPGILAGGINQPLL